MVGLLPIFAAVQISASLWERLPSFRARAKWFVEHRPQFAEFLHFAEEQSTGTHLSRGRTAH